MMYVSGSYLPCVSHSNGVYMYTVFILHQEERIINIEQYYVNIILNTIILPKYNMVIAVYWF